MFDNIEKELPEGLALKQYRGITRGIVTTRGRSNYYTTQLRNMGLMGCLSYQKFIPAEYLNASTAQRLALLQGLMDTDGTANTLHAGGGISYNSTSVKLAVGVQELVWSLGGIASISERQTHYSLNGNKLSGRKSYDVNIRYPRPSELFRISRKQERTNDDNQYATSLKLRVTNIERVEDQPTQCIAIDHPDHLYVTDAHIVTHNTYCFCASAAHDSQRTGMIVLPRYISKWMEDLYKNLDLTPDDIILIKDGKSLMAAMERARDGTLPDFKVALFSLSSLDIWLKYYEEVDAEMYQYPYTPQEFMQALGIGTLGFDEVHQAAHQVYNCIIHFHTRKQIYLSATLKSDDPFIMKMYDTSFPTHERYKTPEWSKYIDVIAVEYGIADAHKVRTSYKRREYNHAAFEDSIRKNRKMFKQYLALIWSIVKQDYLAIRKDGMKMLIFAAKKETCEAIVGYIRVRVAGLGLTVSKYVSEDAYSVLIDSDITASTLGSSGTAVDVPNLVRVLMTTNISAITANQQAVGRLRKLKQWGDVPLEFYYLYCRDIPKHVDYHLKKIRDLEGIVKSHRTVVSSIVLDPNRD